MKPSGRLTLRVGPSIHQDLIRGAQEAQMSLNTYCLYLMTVGVAYRALKRQKDHQKNLTMPKT